MSKSKSARLAEIDANIQACMREMDGLGVGTELGMQIGLGTLPFPEVDIIEPGVSVGGGRVMKIMPPDRRSAAAVAVPIGGAKTAERTDADKKAAAIREAKKAKLDKEIADGKKAWDAATKYLVADGDYSGPGKSVVINGYHVPIDYSNVIDALTDVEKAHRDVMGMKAFTNWCSQMSEKFKITDITIQSIDMFGSRVGFVKFKATVYDSAYKLIPSIVFMRGGAVAMLPVYIVEGDKGTKKKYTVLTKQARVPAGIADFLEIPAGMMDNDDNFAGVASKEIAEELGLVIPARHLFDLTSVVLNPEFPGMYPSAGGCDEFLRFFLYEHPIKEAEFLVLKQDLEERVLGNASEGESITLRIVELDQLIYTAPDMKALSALALYAEFDKKRQAFVEQYRDDTQKVSDGLALEFDRYHNIGPEFERKKAAFVKQNKADPSKEEAALEKRFIAEHNSETEEAKNAFVVTNKANADVVARGLTEAFKQTFKVSSSD